MYRISARLRIVIGLVFLLSSVLLAAKSVGLVPDIERTVIVHRAQMAESLAITSSTILAAGQDAKRIEKPLRIVAGRNRSIQSMAIRRTDGSQIVQIGDHGQWTSDDDISPGTQFTVAIYSSGSRWGQLELRYEPLTSSGWTGQTSLSRFVAFVCSSCFLTFFVYMGFVLQQLGASRDGSMVEANRSTLKTNADSTDQFCPQPNDGCKSALPDERLRQVRLTGSRVFLIGEDSAESKRMQLALGNAGAQVVTAADDDQTVSHAVEEQFDVVLLDMCLPSVDGFSISTRLREQGCTLPIIALAAREQEEECLAAGCSEFLAKPIDVDVLLRTLVPLLDRRTEYVTGATTTAGQMANGDTESIRSTLPTDDEDFAAIVIEFVDRLAEQLDAIDAAWRGRRWDELASLAHWLKGSGGTTGFHEFTQPSVELETAARQHQPDTIQSLIRQLRSLQRRIQVPEQDSNRSGQKTSGVPASSAPHK